MGYRWCLVQTKIRQERIALKNLQLQGFDCFLPVIRTEKLCLGSLQIVQEPLFPRYLFIRLSNSHDGQNWSPIRSTLGVSHLVNFDKVPAEIDACLIDHLRVNAESTKVQTLRAEPIEQATITNGRSTGIETVYQVTNSEGRVILLLNHLTKPSQMGLSSTSNSG